QTNPGQALCLDAFNNVVYCTGAPFGLQAAYNTGNTITTTTGRDIGFTLYNELSDSGLATSFTLTNAGGANAFIINDTSALNNNAIVVKSSGSATLTINENGNLSTSGNILTTGTGTIT